MDVCDDGSGYDIVGMVVMRCDEDGCGVMMKVEGWQPADGGVAEVGGDAAVMGCHEGGDGKIITPRVLELVHHLQARNQEKEERVYLGKLGFSPYIFKPRYESIARTCALDTMDSLGQNMT
ncbi:hypothetical protein Tco_0202099 [Tanacetum coccineum]